MSSANTAWARSVDTIAKRPSRLPFIIVASFMVVPLTAAAVSLTNPGAVAFPMCHGEPGDRRPEIGNGRAHEASQIHRFEVTASKGDAGHPRRDGSLRGGHDLG